MFTNINVTKILVFLALIHGCFYVNAATITQVRDFESGNLDGLKCSGNCPKISSSTVSQGKYSGNFELTQQMATNFRTEVVMGGDGLFDFGTEYWMGLDYRYEDWKKDSNAEMAPFQIHTRPSDYTPECSLGSAFSTAPFFMISEDDKVRFVTYQGKTLWTGGVEKQEWLQITVHFKMSYGSDGYIEAWKNGTFLGRKDGPNMPQYDGCGLLMKRPYFKMGVYKWDWKRKDTDSSRRQIIIDNLKIATGSDGYDLVSNSSVINPQPPTTPVDPVDPEVPLIIDPVWSSDGTITGLMNGATYSANLGLKVDGVNDYLDAGLVKPVGDKVSISGWIYPEDVANCASKDCRIISKATSVNSGDHWLMLSTSSSGTDTRLRFRVKINGITTTVVSTTGNILNDEWTHVSAVYDGSKITLYINNEVSGSSNISGALSQDDTVQTWVGANPPTASDRPWKGYIYSVNVFEGALSDQQRLLLFLDAPEDPVAETPEPVIPVVTEPPVVEVKKNFLLRMCEDVEVVFHPSTGLLEIDKNSTLNNTEFTATEITP